jgi:hypothetical protein
VVVTVPVLDWAAVAGVAAMIAVFVALALVAGR